MDWEAYKRVYHSYELSVNQTRVLTIVAAEVLRDFPKRVPRDLRAPVASGLQRFIRALEEAIAESSGDRVEAVSRTIQVAPPDSAESETHRQLFLHVLALYMAEVMLGAPSAGVDFERLLYSQELVMLFAHLDAFMGDSLRAVCEVRPEVLRTDKKVDWATVLSCGGWEPLVAQLAERYVFEFGWQSLRKRVEFLNEELGLRLGRWGYDLKLLEEAENIRHVVIHNGGRASQEYIARTGRNDVAVGEFVRVTPEYAGEVFDASRMLASELFVDVSQKFFNVAQADISGVWLPGKREPRSDDSGG